MKIELDLWQAIILISMTMGAFWGMAKMLMAQSNRSLDEKFKEIKERLDTQDDSERRMERQIADMRAELPREYVRRDDFLRAIAGFDVRVDQLRLTIERALLERKP